MLKVAIIEDEKHTAQDLANTLKRIDEDIEIVVFLTSVKQAIEFFKKENNINLLFSDIQLPDGLSFEIFKSVQISVPIIFCTAYNQYALNAFEANGIDYLLKPFSKNSVSKALEKYQVLKQIFSTNNNHFDKMIQIFEQKSSPKISSIIVQGEKIIPIETQNIALFYLEDDYVFANTFEMKKLIVAQTLEELEEICGSLFFRANRQYLINRKAIKDAAKFLNRKIIIHLNIPYSDQILVGKLKTSLFLEWLKKN